MDFSSIQDRGDMFSLHLNHDQVKFNIKTTEVLFAAHAWSLDGICTEVNKNEVVLEAFQDNTIIEARQAGHIFCDTLNGKMISFPESMTELSELKDYALDLHALANLSTLAIPLNAKSYSAIAQRPEMGSSKDYMDIFEIGSDMQVKPESKVLDSLHKGQNSYQSKQELCRIMTSKTTQSENEDKLEQKSSIRAELSNRLGNWWTV